MVKRPLEQMSLLGQGDMNKDMEEQSGTKRPIFRVTNN
jgi:hypothetical protein